MSPRLDTEVAIIGGGIVGASAALFLARKGVPVVVIERERCGAKASGVNYGGVRRQGRSAAQLPLARRAHAIWGDLAALIGTDGEYVRSGHLKLARNDADMQALDAYRTHTRGFGMDLELLDRAALSERFPWVGPAAAGASLCPQDGHANPRLVSPAFARAAQAAGAILLEHTRATHVEHDVSGFRIHTDGGTTVHARAVLNCAGAWAGHFAAAFGEPVPETAIHPLMMVTEPLPPFMTVSTGIQGGGIYARQVARGNCIIGGGRGRTTSDDFARPSGDDIATLLARAVTLFPRLAGAHIIRFWTGVEGNMPDHDPVLGASATTPGLFHGFGFSGAGFQIGPAAGEVLCDLVTRGVSDIPIDAFSITRYLPTPTRPILDSHHAVSNPLEISR